MDLQTDRDDWSIDGIRFERTGEIRRTFATIIFFIGQTAAVIETRRMFKTDVFAFAKCAEIMIRTFTTVTAWFIDTRSIVQTWIRAIAEAFVDIRFAVFT
jgi:hypothetical protein